EVGQVEGVAGGHQRGCAGPGHHPGGAEFEGGQASVRTLLYLDRRGRAADGVVVHVRGGLPELLALMPDPGVHDQVELLVGDARALHGLTAGRRRHDAGSLRLRVGHVHGANAVRDLLALGVPALRDRLVGGLDLLRDIGAEGRYVQVVPTHELLQGVNREIASARWSSPLLKQVLRSGTALGRRGKSPIGDIRAVYQVSAMAAGRGLLYSGRTAHRTRLSGAREATCPVRFTDSFDNMLTTTRRWRRYAGSGSTGGRPAKLHCTDRCASLPRTWTPHLSAWPRRCGTRSRSGTRPRSPPKACSGSTTCTPSRTRRPSRCGSTRARPIWKPSAPDRWSPRTAASR